MRTTVSWQKLTSLVHYDVAADEDPLTLRVAGEIDVSSPELVELIGRAGAHRRVALDMSRVSFIDASGLSLLLRGARRLREQGGELVLRRPHRAVRHLLQLCGSEVALAVEDTPAWRRPSPGLVAIGVAAVETATRLGEGTMGDILLADAAGALRIVAERGLPRAIRDLFETVADPECAAGAAWASGSAVLVADVARSPIFLGTPSLETVLDAGIRSAASIPVRTAEGTPIGILSVQRDHPGGWTGGQQRELEALADVTGRLLSSLPDR